MIGVRQYSLEPSDKKTEIIRLNKADNKNDFCFDIETNNGTKSIGVSSPKIDASNAIKMELECFRDAILHNTETPVTIMDGLGAMEIAHLILEKINSKQH